MSLSPAERARFVRHTLLPEIGITGQAKLCAARLRVHADAESRGAQVARDYMERAGITVVSDPSTDVNLVEVALSAPALEQLASPELRHAADMFEGAFTAVEAIKKVVGAGTPAQLPAGFHLGSEES